MIPRYQNRCFEIEIPAVVETEFDRMIPVYLVLEVSDGTETLLCHGFDQEQMERMVQLLNQAWLKGYQQGRNQ